MNIQTSSPKGNDRSPESQVSKRFIFQLVKGSLLCSPWLDHFSRQSRVETLLQICEKMMLYNPNVDLINDNVYTKFGLNFVHSFLRYGAKTKF